MARKEDIGQFGVELLLHDFVTTLHDLSHGVQLEITPHFHHLFFALLIGLLADTPASHYLLGFKEGVGNAFRGCRECFGTDVERQFLGCQK